MNKALGSAFVVAGLVVLGFGIDAHESTSSDVSRFFSGSPTDRSVWLLAIGGFLAVAGLGIAFLGGRGRSKA